jgi:hypothetical protein
VAAASAAYGRSFLPVTSAPLVVQLLLLFRVLLPTVRYLNPPRKLAAGSSEVSWQ